MSRSNDETNHEDYLAAVLDREVVSSPEWCCPAELRVC
jgi:hypothetical protein